MLEKLNKKEHMATVVMCSLLSLTFLYFGFREEKPTVKKVQLQSKIVTGAPADSLINIQGGYVEQTTIEDEIGCRECLDK